MARYGYIRVSTERQSLDRQKDSMEQYHLDEVFSDKKSGKDFEREGYKRLKAKVEKGDEVYIHALDRLGRNKELVKSEWQWFKEKGVTLRVLNMPTTMIEIDGQEWVVDMINNIILEVLGALAEQEREELIVRTKQGLEATRKRGTVLGRPKVTDKIEEAKALVASGMSVNRACECVGIARATYYRGA